MASQIENHNDKALLLILLESTKLEQQMGAAIATETIASPALITAGALTSEKPLATDRGTGKLSTRATLATLQGLLSTAASLPGRKLLFFLSDVHS